MTLHPTDLRDLLISVGKRELMSRFRRVGSRIKADGSLVTDADKASQEAIRQALAERWPETTFLGEEMEPAEQEAILAEGKCPLWVLDPLDGTTNFASGFPCFAISLALLEDGAVSFGMVYDPARNECFWAERGRGAWCNGEPLRLEAGPAGLGDCVALIDFKRLPPDLACRLVCSPPYRSQRGLGSVALEWCWLAAGRGHLYLHGGQRLWDYAAGELILREAGGAVLGGPAALDLATKGAVAACDDRLLQNWADWLQPSESAGR